MATKVIFSVVLFALTLVGHSQSIFYKTYGGNGYDTGNDVIQLETDSSFYIAGSSSSVSDAPSQAMLLHVDKHGEFLASYFYGGPLSDVGVRVMHKPGVGFWIAGYSNSFSNDANFDFYLIKLNEDYEMVWQKTYGTANWERLHDAILLPDEGVLLVGEVEGLGVEGKDAYMVRTDANGDIDWQQTHSGSMNDVAYTCALFDEESFLVGGAWGIGEWNAWLAKFDLGGNIIWSRNDYLTDRVGEIRDLIKDDNIYFYGNWSALPYTENTKKKYQGVAHLTNELIFNVFESGVNDTHVSLTKLRTNRFYGAAAEDNPDFFGDVGLRTAIYGNDGGGFFYGFTHLVHGNQLTPGKLITSLDTCLVFVGTILDPSYSSGGGNVVLLKITDQTNSLETIVSSPILSLQSFAESGFQLYPNPTIAAVEIRLPEGTVGTRFSVFDMQGKVVLNDLFQEYIDLQNLESGTYILSIETNTGTRYTRILKQ